MLYKYLLGEISIDEIRYKRFQRDSLIEAFLIITSSITGGKQEKMKNAIMSLGLIDIIEKGLNSILPSKRMRSCYLLGFLGSKRSTHNLTRALFDRNSKVTSSAIIALGEIKEETSVKSLMQYFINCSFSHAWLIAAILPFFGNKIYTYVKPYLNPDILPPKKVIMLIKAIDNFRLLEGFKELINLYKNINNLDIKINALIAIGKINDILAIKTVIDALSDKDWQIRAIACNLIGEMSIKGAVYRLILLIDDKSFFVRRNACSALIKLGRIGIFALLSSLESEDRYSRDIIVQTLEESGILEDAIKNIQNKDEKKRNESLEIIKVLINKGYKEYLSNYHDSIDVINKLLK